VAAGFGKRAPAAHEARRILRRQIRKALKALARRRPGDDDIHDARKRIKSARATLRLMRAVISKRDYRDGNRLLRKAAAPLSAPRDAKILVEACDGVLQRSPQARELDGTRRLRAALVRSRIEARRVLLHDGQLQRSCRLLRRARRAAARWSLRSGGASALAAGAQLIYARGREAMQYVRTEPSVAALHEWRKQAKYLYLQLEILEPLYGPSVARLAQRLHDLSDELGEDHDLALLRLSAAAHHSDFSSAAQASDFARLIGHTRKTLQRRALLRGLRLYQPGPAGFVQRLAVSRVGRVSRGRQRRRARSNPRRRR
jgi:CHAD domain-containing protein